MQFFLFFYFFFIINYYIMKGDDALDIFKNVREYILLLPIHEQIREINRMIKCHKNIIIHVYK